MNGNVIKPSNVSNEILDDSVANNVTNVSKGTKKKRNNLWLIVFLILVLMGVMGFGGWKLGTMYATVENEENEKNKKIEEDKVENKEDYESVKPSKNEEYTFVKELSTTVGDEDNEFEIVAYYYIDMKTVNADEEETLEQYFLRREVFVNGKMIGDTTLINLYDTENEAILGIDKTDLDKVLLLDDTNNSDKYLIIDLFNNNGAYDEEENSLLYYDVSYTTSFIVNKEGTILKQINTTNPGFGLGGIPVNENSITGRTYIDNTFDIQEWELPEDTKYLIYANDSFLDYHNNYIYYIKVDCDTADEYKLVVTDGKIVEEQVTSYKDLTLGAGGC